MYKAPIVLAAAGTALLLALIVFIEVREYFWRKRDLRLYHLHRRKVHGR